MADYKILYWQESLRKSKQRTTETKSLFDARKVHGADRRGSPHGAGCRAPTIT